MISYWDTLFAILNIGLAIVMVSVITFTGVVVIKKIRRK